MSQVLGFAIKVILGTFIVQVTWFHRLRKAHCCSRASKAESWEHLRAPEQAPLWQILAWTLRFMEPCMLAVCSSARAVKQILLPVP